MAILAHPEKIGGGGMPCTGVRTAPLAGGAGPRPAAPLARAAIVVAHPDDEILWFSSLVAQVGRIVICYGAISPNSRNAVNRRRALAAYPLDTVIFLDLPIPPAGAAPAREAQDRAVLTERLAPALVGTDIVFTHNPWGEYGQADHQRVHAAIGGLWPVMGFALYVSCYAARHQLAGIAVALGASGGVGEVMTLPLRRVDRAAIFALYRAHSCWSWTLLWVWPRREHFLRLRGDQSGAAAVEIPVRVFGSRVKHSRAEMRQARRHLLPTPTRERRLAASAHG
jgi:LmbE family N-acetylglucosaminyl deacetylase